MNFAVVNLGCKVNRVESDDAAALLAARGRETREEDADLVVVNTCTVTGEAEKKTRKAVRRALRANDRALVVVTGCAAALDPSFFEGLDDRVEVVGKAALRERIAEVADALSSSQATLGEGDAVAAEEASVPVAHDGASLLRVGTGFRTRVGVKVQDGCDNACSFCIVHVARGRAASRPADEVVRECAAYAAAGAKEIVLTGINLGSYRDVGASRCDARETRLPDLLEMLLDETADLRAPNEPPVRFRISSIEPRDVGGDLVEVLARSEGRVCRHLHLPLQSGSSKVLREMARPYDAAAYLALVHELRERVSGIALSTDVIVGFPGETDGDFQETLSLSRACGFSKIHVFPYSRRAGTPAAAREDQVGAAAKAARAARLRALSDELRRADYARRAGSVELALVEEDGLATVESHHRVAAPPGAALGSLVPIRLPECPAEEL
ncbi:2-methylthioadenine synthetase [Gordonibacter sp. An230]|uniref:MiaB/RimO family radical SAM methylthiotransferase n=1 Tax=Gordonibacter sp. An230 TaxID=1965592 RepID=UPI000B38CB7A|nr:MiaB/RimO family radical SAM methylthiotransferase [Gordonibacter sp. An230]OUO91509.1 2-methylthioadenine synthetase [Gordonibacter sp. An230]